MSKKNSLAPQLDVKAVTADMSVDGMRIYTSCHVPEEVLIIALERNGYAVTKKDSAVFTVEVKLKDPHIALSEDHQEQLADMVKELKATIGDCRFEQDLAARIDVLIDGVSS